MPRAPSTDPRTPHHRPPAPGARPKGVAQGKAKPWLPLQCIHAARPTPPTGQVPTARRKIPVKSCHQTAKNATRQNPLTVTTLAEHASPYSVSPPSVVVSVIRFCSQSLFFLLYSPVYAFAALRPSPPLPLPAHPRPACLAASAHAHARPACLAYDHINMHFR